MAHVVIDQIHGLSLAQAVAIANAWQQAGEADFALVCETHEMAERVEIQFSRAGAKGMLRADAERFYLEVELGFLLRPYARKIQDALLVQLTQALQGAVSPSGMTTSGGKPLETGA